MKRFTVIILSLFLLPACSHLSGTRVPSSVPRSFTPMSKDTRLILKQPVPFINTEDNKKTVSMISRKHFSHNGANYSCKLSAQVPKQNTYFVQDGTTFEYKEPTVAATGNYHFQPKKGAQVNLTCYSDLDGQVKKNVFIEEVQMAFPSDVLVIENNI